LLSPQKNFTPQQKIAPALRQAVGSHSPHSATLYCGLSVSATFAPLADGSRLMQQPKNALPFRYATFRCIFSAALRAVLPALFLCCAHAQPPTTHP
jgi:hypothetical protein